MPLAGFGEETFETVDEDIEYWSSVLLPSVQVLDNTVRQTLHIIMHN